MSHSIKSEKKYSLSDHYDGKRFYNPGLVIKKGFKEVLKMIFEGRNTEKWPKWVENHAQPVFAKDLTPAQAYITYINHACHLIQLQNLNILTDPIFADRAGPFSLLGPKRVRHPGVLLEKLPQINVVVISHNHYDHMDLPSLVTLDAMFQPLFIVPLGNGRYLEQKGIKHIIELDWWQSYALNPMQTITAVPAQHWSRRVLNDINQALWSGFWFQSYDIKIYFAGDTGYGPLFSSIEQKLGAPNISILPIGSYAPRWFMQPQHMNPEEAVLACIDLKCHLNIATHHRTFRLSHEGIDEPVTNLKKSMLAHHIPENEFLAPENGETICYQA